VEQWLQRSRTRIRYNKQHMAPLEEITKVRFPRVGELRAAVMAGLVPAIPFPA